jgi:hypothetical protein
VVNTHAMAPWRLKHFADSQVLWWHVKNLLAWNKDAQLLCPPSQNPALSAAWLPRHHGDSVNRRGSLPDLHALLFAPQATVALRTTMPSFSLR